MDPKFKITSGLLKAYTSDDGVRRLKTTASSTIVDHGKDRMLPSAIQRMAESAEQNMTIFLNHSYAVPEDVLGSVESTEIRQAGTGPDGTIYDLDFDIRLNESNPRALKTYEAIESGVKLGTSIGAIVKEWDKNKEGGWDIRDVELMEASIVGIPANPRSWVQHARKSLDDLLADELTVSPEGVIVNAVEETVTEVTETVVETEETIEEVEKAMACDCGENCDCGKACCSTKSIDPAEATKAGVWVDLKPSGAVNVVVDTATPEAPDAGATKEASAQEALADPESAIKADSPVDETTPDEALVQQAETTLGIARHVESLVTKVRELVEELDEERAIRLHLQDSLDDAQSDLRVAKEIIDRIADLPLPRKARMNAAVTEFKSRLSGVYSEEFLKLLETE
jgi:HK97 family phage prohead protease